MDKLARAIQYSLRVIQSPQYKAWNRQPYRYETAQNRWGPHFMNILQLENHGSFEFNDNLNTIKRKLKLYKTMKSSEKALLTRLYRPGFSNIGYPMRNNNTHIKPVRNWYLNVLAKKYNVPKNWLNEIPAIAQSKPGKYIEYSIGKKYYPQYANRNIAAKQIVRRVGTLYSKRLDKRISMSKKATRPLPNEIREPIMNIAFPFTRRRRSPSVGRTFNS